MPQFRHRLLTILLAVVVALLAVGAVLVATGRFGFVTTHGVSMNPVYYQGDLVVISRRPPYRVGEIAAYRVPGGKLVVLHRIIGADATGFTFKGDNNQSIDPSHPAPDQLIGRAVLHLSHGGIWLQRAASPLTLGLATASLVAVSGPIRRRRDRRKGHVSTHASHSRHKALRALRELPPHLSAALATAATAALGLGLAAPAWTLPQEGAATTTAQVRRQMIFSYTATVRRTAAYDGTTVSAPDPIFRRVTNSVDVRFRYIGPRGIISTVADLSTPSGWHSTSTLTEAASTTGDGGSQTVRLDLARLEARAQAAASVTGIPVAQVTVAVTPTVRTATGAPFAPTLRLALTPMQLSLAGGPTSLTVTEATPASIPATPRRGIAVAGLELSVPTARTTSSLMLLASLVGAAGILCWSRRARQLSEGAAIRRRYAALLAEVAPLGDVPGQPVVDVPTMATLAKLAEHYGLLILHWAQDAADIFVVQDLTTTYRFRAGSVVATRQPGTDTESVHPR